MLHDAVDFGDERLALGVARLEQLFDARQTLGDVVGAGHATGVEGAQRQLRARLADGLGGDDADRLAQLDHAAACQVFAVAHAADAEARFAGERRAHKGLLDAVALARWPAPLR